MPFILANLKPKLIPGLALVLSGATLFAADQKDFNKEQVDALWPELWKMGATPVKAPKVDPLTESQVVKEMAGKWNVLCAPKVFYISLETNRQVSVGGIQVGQAWKKHGEWKVVSGKLLLFVPENPLPDFIFHARGKTFIFDPGSDTLMSEMQRPDQQARPETGAQLGQPIHPMAGKISKAQVLEILNSIDQGVSRKDAGAVVANFASNAVITATEIEGKWTGTDKDDTASYRKKLAAGFQAGVDDYKLQRKEVVVEIAPDGRKATSQSTLIETYRWDGKSNEAVTHESASFEIVGERVLLTKMDSKITTKP